MRTVAVSILSLLALSICSISSTASAQHPAVSFIQQLGNRAFQARSISNPDRRRAAYCDLIQRSVATEALAEYVLGDYLNSARTGQISELRSLLEEMLVGEFSRAFGVASGGELEVRDRVINMGEDVGVRAQLRDSEGVSRYRFQFQVNRPESRPKIVDAQIEGRSIARNLRQEYQRIMSRASSSPVETLLTELRGEYPSCP